MDDRVLTSALPDKRNSPSDLVPLRTIDTRRVPTTDRFMYELNDHLHRPRCTILGIHHIRLRRHVHDALDPGSPHDSLYGFSRGSCSLVFVYDV